MKKASKLRLHFSMNLREAREKKELSQEALADIAKIHRTYVGSVERAESNVTIDNIAKLAEALGVPPETLVKYRSEEASKSQIPTFRRKKPAPDS